MKKVLWKELSEGFRSSAVKPLIRTTFTYDEIEPAFRYMTTGKHMGKLVIKIRNEEVNTSPVRGHRTLFKALPRFSCNPDCTYIILGGLGGYGLELADWLVVRGARKLVLTSISGVKSGYQAYRLKHDDVAFPKSCEDLLKAANVMGPVDGIFNLAVVLQGVLFENQSEEYFRISLAPKAIATKNLDSISRVVCPNLRYFVVFSSASCSRGHTGQTNYGMANSVMERICKARKGEGYPALAIQWGAIGMDSMMAVEIKQTLERQYEVFLTAQDIRGLTIAKLKEMSCGEVEPTKPQDGDKNILPEDMQLLLRYIGDEKTANIPSVRMNTAVGYNDNAPIVFGLAGIDRMAAVFEPIAKHMKFYFTCLQFCTGYQSESIEELAKSLVKFIESTPGNFSIIAYSFGCVVATELMQLLERSGKIGKALFIDGAPDMVTKITKTYFPDESDEIFETSLLCIVMTRYMPFDEILKHKYNIMKQKTYEEKIIETAKSARNRIRSLRKYQLKP